MATPPPNDEDVGPNVSTQINGPTLLLRPFLLMSFSAYYFFETIFHLTLSFNFKPFLSVEDFKDEWFARFWAFFGPRSREACAPSVMPLLENHASGVCLDIGPGTGMWLELFSRANNPDITKIYGIEPNLALHQSLRENARKAGLDGVYEIIGCGAEELQTKGGIQKGSIDTIITVQCLCSIPTPELIIKELFPLLKPGGRWIVFEHIKTKYQGYFVSYWQHIINVPWQHMFNGCNLVRETDEWLLKAGDWKEVTLRPSKGEGPYDTVPHVLGTLTKR